MVKPDTITDHLAYGDAIVERFDSLGLPAGLKPFAADFKKIHTSYKTSCKEVEAARKSRDAALALIGQLDDTLDGHVLLLADDVVGARMGDRRNPFRKWSSHSPVRLTALPYATEVKAVHELVDNLAGDKPPAAVAKTMKLCAGGADAVADAIQKLSGPQALYDKALRARDDLLPDWHKALNRLDKHAAAVWVDEPESRDALLAPPESVQRPLRKRRNKTPKAPKDPQ